MYYEINVAKNGKHYFATHKRSLSMCLPPEAIDMAQNFKKRFPLEEGFTVTMTKWEEQGKQIRIPTQEQG